MQSIRKLLEPVEGSSVWSMPIPDIGPAAWKPAGKTILYVLLSCSVAYAFYRGFRAPNLWSVNYYQIGYLDGFFRRGLLGTFLVPFGCARFDYFFIAKIQFLVLLFALCLFIYIGVRNLEIPTLILFFLSAAGGYVFDEVGYVEQFQWILGFLSVWALARKQHYLAAILMSLSVMSHEMALFTVLPLVLAYSIVHMKPTFSEYARMFGPPAMIFLLILLFFQLVPESVVSQYAGKAANCGFAVLKEQYLQVFANQFVGTRTRLYFSAGELLLVILPLLVLASVLAWNIRRKLALTRMKTILVWCCCVSPLLLGFFGWDTSRWIFLAFTQVIAIRLIFASKMQAGGMHVMEVSFLLALIVSGLLLQLDYFDGFFPRRFSADNFAAFPAYVRDQLSELPVQ